MLTRPTPGSCEIFCAMRVSAMILHLRHRHGVGHHRERQNRRIRRIDLGVDRRRRKILRQQIAGRIDRRLHFLLGNIEAEARSNCSVTTDAPAELIDDISLQARHLAELPLQRRRHRRRHHFRAGAGQEGLHLDGRVIDFRQRRKRQEKESNDADQHDRDHQQRRRDRAE